MAGSEALRHYGLTDRMTDGPTERHSGLKSYVNLTDNNDINGPIHLFFDTSLCTTKKMIIIIHKKNGDLERI